MAIDLNDPTADFSSLIRDITDEEVEYFQEEGWLHVRNLITPELALKVREHVKKWSGIEFDEWPQDAAEQARCMQQLEAMKDRTKKFLMSRADPWLGNFFEQRKLGEASARLLKAQSVKKLSETLHFKPPVSSGHGKPLAWHQDFQAIPIDRSAAIQTWIALAPIVPEMGPMQHLRGSHKEGSLGRHIFAGELAEEVNPEIFARRKVTSTRNYQPGDADFHHCLTYHRSGLNETDRIRWAVSSIRFSTRCLYTGMPSIQADGLGMEPFKYFDHPNFPTVYP